MLRDHSTPDSYSPPQSAPDIHRKLQKVVAEGERSLHQLMQLATLVYYNRTSLKREIRIKNTRTLLLCSGSSPPNGAPLPGHATNVDRKDTSIEKVKEEDSPGDSPVPLQDHALM
jgi:hypothetical protein